MKKAKIVLLVLVILFGVIQLIPGMVNRNNPPVESDIPTSPEVKAVLKKACYDCHSNESKWPWYSYVAPVSWLVSHDVQEAREEMNFSIWNSYEPKEQAEMHEDCWEMVSKNEMPLWFYVPLHPEAKLSEEDRMLIKNWAVGSSGSFQEEEQENEE